MRRWAVAEWVFLGLLLGAVPPAGAQTTSSTSTTSSTVVAETVVTVEPGPARIGEFRQPCNDVIVAGIEERLSFVLRRTGPTAAPLTVTYALSGSAGAGVHYEPLPGTATFPAGAAAISVPVVPKPTPRGEIVELTMVVTGGTPLAPPMTPATIRFISPPPNAPAECGYFFSDDPWNTAQTIAVGQVPRSLTLLELAVPIVIPSTGNFRVLNGSLPPGVQLNSDGSFGGSASTPGTFSAGIEACRPRPPGTCVTTSLVVVVTGGVSRREPLPRTGAAGTSTLLEAATGLVLLGLLAVALAGGASMDGRGALASFLRLRRRHAGAAGAPPGRPPGPRR